MVGSLDGGKKKKKKKVYTTKKKNKHIHKRVKMGIYSLYSVDGTFFAIQVKETSPSNVKLVLPAAQELLWPSIGIVTTADFAILPSRWTLKPWRRTKKLWKRKRLLFRLKRRPKKKKLPIKLRQEKAKKMPKKAKRNDISPQAHSSVSLHLSKAEMRLPKDSTFSINLKQYYKLSMNSPTKIEKYDHMAKVIIIGDSGIGKTVLITRYC